MNVSEAVTTPIAAKAAGAITYAASGAAIFFGLNANELGVFLGLFIAFGAGVTKALIEYHFKQKHFKMVEKYIASGSFERRKEERREDVCGQCPLIKHHHDYDGT